MTNLTCRACLGALGAPFLSLGNQPLSNAYLRADQLSIAEPTYPLDVYHCEKCHLVQLPECEKASNIFNEDYAYFSSFSFSWLKHCRAFAHMACARFGLNEKSLVLEVASNDGYLLQYFKEKGIPVLGVEPAAACARAAVEKGVPTDVCFFDVPYAAQLAASGRKADLIIGNNVFAHNPNIRDFTRALKIALKPEGVISLEFPHLLCMMQGNQFDTVYHEHYSYLALHPVISLLSEYHLAVFDVEELPTHGGSLRVYACNERADRAKVAAHVAKVLADEEVAGLLDAGVYASYRAGVEKVKRQVRRFLIDAREHGKRVIGYGAPAKGNTLLNYCGISADLLEFTVDRNPYKQGRFLPGTHIPIKRPEDAVEARPDFLFILPWNLAAEISEQMKIIGSWSGKFVTAIPELEVF